MSHRARSAAASLAIAGGKTGVAISGAGALALNVIGSGTSAYIKDSDFSDFNGANGSIGGNVDIDAQNSSSIAAIVGALLIMWRNVLAFARKIFRRVRNVFSRMDIPAKSKHPLAGRAHRVKLAVPE